MEYLQKLFKLLITRVKIFFIAFRQARTRILYSIFGNLFPLLLGPIILFFIKEDFKYSELLASQNLIIYSATFAISSMFIWKKNTTDKNDFEGMLGYIILILVITILFAVSYTNYFHKNIFDYVTIGVFIFSILLYTYQEIRTGYLINQNGNMKDERKKDYQNLSDDFDKAS